MSHARVSRDRDAGLNVQALVRRVPAMSAVPPEKVPKWITALAEQGVFERYKSFRVPVDTAKRVAEAFEHSRHL